MARWVFGVRKDRGERACRFEPAFVLCEDGSLLPIHSGVVLSTSGLDISPDDDVLYRRVEVA